MVSASSESNLGGLTPVVAPANGKGAHVTRGGAPPSSDSPAAPRGSGFAGDLVELDEEANFSPDYDEDIDPNLGETQARSDDWVSNVVTRDTQARSDDWVSNVVARDTVGKAIILQQERIRLRQAQAERVIAMLIVIHPININATMITCIDTHLNIRSAIF